MELRKIAVLILIAGTNATRFLPSEGHDRPNSPSILDGFLRFINPGGGPGGLRGGLPDEQHIRNLARSAVDYGVVALTRFLGPALRAGGLGGAGGGGGLGGLGGAGSGSIPSFRNSPDGDGGNLSLDEDFADFEDNSRENSRSRRRAGLFGDIVKSDPLSVPEQLDGHENRTRVGTVQALTSENAHSSSVIHGGFGFLVSLIGFMSVVLQIVL